MFVSVALERTDNALGLEPYSVHSRTVVLFAVASFQLHVEANPIYIFIFIYSARSAHFEDLLVFGAQC